MKRTPETISFHEGRLPHWEVSDGKYFATLCLLGAIPAAAVKRFKEERKALETLQGGELLRKKREILAQMEKHLDSKSAPRLLAEPAIAEMVMEAIEFRQRQGLWNVIEFVIMPSHLHIFLEPLEDSLFETLVEFKRWTGHRAADLRGVRAKRFWAREWFDHWSRSSEQDERIVKYIRMNPVKAGLVKNYKAWRYGSWSPKP